MVVENKTKGDINMETEELMTAKQISQLLGVSQMTVWNWSNMGKLKPYRIGPRSTRYKRSEVFAELKPLVRKNTITPK
jgi:excisionase family DNA binding protein